jgi:DNA polymerase III delta subunit
MAAPNPIQELARLERLVKSGLPKVCLLTGANDWFRTQALDHLLATAVPADAELRIVDAGSLRADGSGGGDAEADDDADDGAESGGAGTTECPELQDLRGGGLFAKRAVVAVRRGTNWWKLHAATLAGEIERFAAGSSFVLEAPKLDRRKKVAAALVKTVEQAGGLFEFRDLYAAGFGESGVQPGGELCQWLLARAKKLGIAMQPEAGLLTIAQVGQALPELAAELERLAAAFGPDKQRPPLGPEDLREKLHCSFESTPFEFAEAVLLRDRRRAWRSLAAMFARGVRGKGGRNVDPGGLLPFTSSWLFGQLSKTYEARLALDAGASERDVAKDAGVFQFVDRFVAQVRGNRAPQLRRGILALHACQRSSRLTGEDPEVLLERFLQQWFDGAPVPTAAELGL